MVILMDDTGNVEDEEEIELSKYLLEKFNVCKLCWMWLANIGSFFIRLSSSCGATGTLGKHSTYIACGTM
jgi:hypothetical protein